MTSQMKLVEDHQGANVSTVSQSVEPSALPPTPPRRMRECRNCGRRPGLQRRELCPAFGRICRKCHKPNHFAAKCRGQASATSVQTVEDSLPHATESAEEIFPLQMSVHGLDDSQFVTLRLESGSYIRFQVDTGAQCNVIPVDVYKKATRDTSLAKVTPTHAQVTAYGGGTLPVIGAVLLRVWRGDFRCRLDFKLINCAGIRPLLGRKACLGMKLVTYLDNDELHKPVTGDAPVYALEGSSPLTIEQLLNKHSNVFGPGVGLLNGKYHIVLDGQVPPVQHPPRRVPVPLRNILKETLEDLVQQNILAQVQKPTPWISSMVVVPKKDGKLRICLDPRDLNRAIRREHYPLPTIEDVATRLHGAKVFTVLDVRKGFWHVELDEESSFLTTFNTPFGRYRWKRMPFGICSAPEVFRSLLKVFMGLRLLQTTLWW